MLRLRKDCTIIKYLKELALASFATKKAGTSLKLKMAEEIVTLSEDDHDIKVQAALDSEVIILEILRESDFPILARHNPENTVSIFQS